MAPVLFPCMLAWLLVTLTTVYLLRHDRRQRNLPPGPRPLPVIGSLHLLGNQPHRSLARLAKIHGPLISLRLGAVTTVVASSPAAAREFLQRHDAIFCNRSVIDAPGNHTKNSNSTTWLPANAPRWRALRKIMGTELFAPHRLDALQHLRRDKVQDLVDHVGRLARKGEPVNIGRVAFITSLNLVSRTIFSRDLTSLDDDGASREFQELVTDIMEAHGSPNISDYFPVLAAADLQGWRRHLARLHRIFDEEIDGRLRDREAGEPRKNDFLDLLLDAAEDGDNTARLDDRDTLRSLFTDLFAAGSDTSSSTVEWAMAELLQSPTSMARACDELAAVIGSRKSIEESDISQLSYLQAVVKETFRLHPPAPLLVPRRAQVDIKIMDYTIPQDSRVFINVWAMDRDKDTWSRPEKFMPERFLGKTIDLRGGDFNLIPFGGGRRICPGMPLAIRMVHLLLASLLNQFTWRLPLKDEINGLDMAEKFGLTLTKALPLYATATPI